MCKKILVLFLVFFSTDAFTQSSPDKLDIVSWNVEWFGSGFESPADDNLQEQNVKTALRLMNADLYGLVEIVDTMRLRRLTDSLGAHFDYVISPFSSNNSTGTGTSWLNGQKLAFIFNTNIFTNVSARGLMRNSGPAYTNWASGRFPYMLTADVTLNNITKKINFILLHGKAGSTESDYNRRRDGAQELKDTLDTYYSSALNFIIGDFNDALNTTICTTCQSQASSFDMIVRDSTDSDHYKSITLPLGQAGQTSMTNYPNVVDNHVISNEVAPFYVPNSAYIRTDIAGMIPNYGITTSDHYPVYSQYNFTGVSTGIITVVPAFLELSVTPNPFAQTIYIHLRKPLKDVSFQLLDGNGRIIKAYQYKILMAGTQPGINIQGLPAGIYFLRVQTLKYQSTVRLVRL